MKKISVCLILVLFAAFTLVADDESDVILKAQNDARADGLNYHPFWWTVDAIVLPSACYFGGLAVYGWEAAIPGGILIAAGVPLLGYCTGKASVPAAGITAIQDQYEDAYLVSLYQTEYTKTLTKIQRRKRGNYALIGFGVSVVVIGVVFLGILVAD